MWASFCVDGEGAFAHLWQVPVPWQRLVPAAQRPEASPGPSAARGFMQCHPASVAVQEEMGSDPWNRC